ncbi:hypothetical protein BCR42DRAFT_370718 [Absidia repens]|uniref:GATA-type domain-containing protein n=1 Tax=Absidia repens TaxID=90262 RepID=A0A1X2IR82_9FUNG|nr:hypothetical protein BCR42DRAFT_370718 [Absidia repens]
MNPFVFLGDDISLFQPLDLFDKESSLDQLFTQHNATTTSSSSSSSSSSSTATSTPSPAMNHLPTSLLDDSLLDDMLTQTLSSPTNPFFHLDNTEYTSNTLTTISTTAATNGTMNDAMIGPIQRRSDRTIRKKPSPPGQATMPIRVCAKSRRPPRHIECNNCHATKSPLWRRTPDRKETLCNACGLYYRQYKSHRAIQSRYKSALGRTHNNNSNGSSNNEFSIKVSGFSETASSSSSSSTDCVNCHQTKTPLWRKNKRGESVCNACGLYSRLHHRDRPVKMRKTTIQRRRRDYWHTDEETTSTSTAATTTTTGQPQDTTGRFATLLAQMDRSQMQGFLGMLEQRCDVVRTLLDLSGNGSG